VLRIRDVYPGSRIRTVSIPDPGSSSKNLSILTPKKAKKWCAAGFALLNLPKGKSLGRSKPETNSSNEQALATHCVGFLLYPSSVELPYAK
jgi:hypothetical protein